jgi:hypothetical protein
VAVILVLVVQPEQHSLVVVVWEHLAVGAVEVAELEPQ